MFHTMGPKLLRDLSPHLAVLTLGLKNDVPDLVSLVISEKISFIKGGDKSFLTLITSC